MATDTARPLPGGPLAIDLLNTAWRTGDGPYDWLDDDAAVEEFAAAHGHPVGSGEVGAARTSLVETRGLVQRLFESDPSESSLLTDEVNAALESARTIVVPGEAGPALTITGDQSHNAVAVEALVNAIELQRDRPDRVRSCEHESCVLWFLDTSKSGRRRWCSMETCGNRAKAQRHYQRSTQSTN